MEVNSRRNTSKSGKLSSQGIENLVGSEADGGEGAARLHYKPYSFI